MAVGKPERTTQHRVLALFREEVGYRYLGEWSDRAGNSNIEEGLLSDWLKKCGYSTPQINRALDILRREAVSWSWEIASRRLAMTLTTTNERVV